jgi:hypothetical protein
MKCCSDRLNPHHLLDGMIAAGTGAADSRRCADVARYEPRRQNPNGRGRPGGVAQMCHVGSLRSQAVNPPPHGTMENDPFCKQ